MGSCPDTDIDPGCLSSKYVWLDLLCYKIDTQVQTLLESSGSVWTFCGWKVGERPKKHA